MCFFFFFGGGEINLVYWLDILFLPASADMKADSYFQCCLMQAD